jgi:hypothetical protein
MRTDCLRQAIDRLKEELTTLADLTGPAGADDMTMDDEMDEDYSRILQDAGVLMIPASSRRRKSAPRSTKHILFTEVGDSGALNDFLWKVL